MFNLVSFVQWVGVEDALILEMRSLASGVMTRPGAKQSWKYWGADLPSYGELVQKVKACVECLPESFEDQEDMLQQTVLVAMQVLSPPIRGKPFYTMELCDKGDNSMPSMMFSVSEMIFFRLARLRGEC